MGGLEAQVAVITVVIGTCVALLKQLTSLATAAREFRTAVTEAQRAGEEVPEEARETIRRGTGRFFTWVLIIIGTLVAPSWIILSLVMSIGSTYYASVTPDFGAFASILAITTGTFGSLYPLAWGIYIYPIFCEVFENRDRRSQDLQSGDQGQQTRS